MNSYLSPLVPATDRCEQVLEGPDVVTTVLGEGTGPRLQLRSNCERMLSVSEPDPASIENGELTIARTPWGVWSFGVDTRARAATSGKRWQWCALRATAGGTPADTIGDVRASDNPALTLVVQLASSGPGPRTASVAARWVHLPTGAAVVVSGVILGQPTYPRGVLGSASVPPLWLSGLLAGGDTPYLWASADLRALGIAALCDAQPVRVLGLDIAALARIAIGAYPDLWKQIRGDGETQWRDLALGYVELGLEVEDQGALSARIDQWELAPGGGMPPVGNVLA